MCSSDLSKPKLDPLLGGLETLPDSVNPEGGNPDDVLDLTEAMAAPVEEHPSFQTINGEADVVFAEPPPPQPAPVRQAAGEAKMHYSSSRPADNTLLSEDTSAAVDSAFKALAQTVLVHNARTLEDLVREMLRPMLKSWLDDNLPGMVERIVKAEIERVSRGRG